jgi:LysM domain
MPARLSGAGPRRVAAVALASSSLVAAAALGSIFLSTARDSWTAIAAAGPAGPADGILLMAGLGGALLSIWLGLGMTLSALSALPGALGHLCRRLAARIAPVAVRKVVAFVLGTTLTAALIPGTAVADNNHGGGRAAVVAAASYEARAVSSVSSVSGVSGVNGVNGVNGVKSLAVAAPDASFRFVSDPPHVSGAMDAAPPPEWSMDRRESPQEAVVVLRGDTLWSIAARHLGAGATAAEITVEWHRWLATNRGLIGADPNLILPGQELLPPASPRAGS